MRQLLTLPSIIEVNGLVWTELAVRGELLAELLNDNLSERLQLSQRRHEAEGSKTPLMVRAGLRLRPLILAASIGSVAWGIPAIGCVPYPGRVVNVIVLTRFRDAAFEAGRASTLRAFDTFSNTPLDDNASQRSPSVVMEASDRSHRVDSRPTDLRLPLCDLSEMFDNSHFDNLTISVSESVPEDHLCHFQDSSSGLSSSGSGYEPVSRVTGSFVSDSSQYPAGWPINVDTAQKSSATSRAN